MKSDADKMMKRLNIVNWYFHHTNDIFALPKISM